MRPQYYYRYILCILFLLPASLFLQGRQVSDSLKTDSASSPLPAPSVLYQQATRYAAAGHYRESIPFFEKAIAIVSKNNAPDIALLVDYSNELAAAHVTLQQYPEALTIYQGLLPYNRNINELRHHIASIYLATGRYTTALSYLHQVYYPEHKSDGIIKKYNDLAAVLLALNRNDSAGYFIHIADSLQTQNKPPRKNTTYALTLRYKGDWERKQGNYSAALQHYQRVIGELLPSFNNPDVYSNPDNFTGAHSVVGLFEALQVKAETLEALYNQGKNYKDLAAALQTVLTITKLTGYLEQTDTSDETRLFLSNKKNGTLHQPINLSLQLFRQTRDTGYLRQAFYFDEQHKAAVIKQAGKAGSLNAAHTVTIAGLQQKIIPPNSVLLSYHVRDSILLGFLITPTSFQHFTVPVTDSFFNTIRALNRDLQLVAGINNKSLGRQARYLYAHLIQPVAEKIAPFENLMIIPGDQLQQIPFEVLQDSAGNYLLNRYSIQYNYACSLLKAGGSKKHEGDYTLTSLWQTADRATDYITRRFHYYLRHEIPAARALQKAKQDYLNSSFIEGRFKTAAYWAPLRLTGQFEYKQGFARWWYFVLGAVALVLLGFILGFLKFKQNRE